MNFKSHLRVGALMLGLSLCGGLLGATAHAAPGATAGKDGKAGKAGKGQRGAMRGGGMKMMRELNLSDAQKQKLMPIMKGMREQMMALRDNTTLDRKAKMTKMKAMRAEMEKKVGAILTTEQKKKLDAMKAKAKAERAANGKGEKRGDRAGKGKRGGPQAPAPAM